MLFGIYLHFRYFCRFISGFCGHFAVTLRSLCGHFLETCIDFKKSMEGRVGCLAFLKLFHWRIFEISCHCGGGEAAAISEIPTSSFGAMKWRLFTRPLFDICISWRGEKANGKHRHYANESILFSLKGSTTTTLRE